MSMLFRMVNVVENCDTQKHTEHAFLLVARGAHVMAMSLAPHTIVMMVASVVVVAEQ